MAATIKDIARQAGVSIATVSRVITGSRGVNQENREKVEAILKEAGYKPNMAARQLVKGADITPSILVSLPLQVTPFFTSVIKGIRGVTHSENVNLVLEENEPKAMEQLLELTSEGTAGVLILSRALSAEEKRLFKLHHIPYVLVDGKDFDSHCLFINSIYGSYQAARYLYELGVRKPLYIGNPIPEFGTQRDRWMGFKAFWDELQLPVKSLLGEADGSSEGFLSLGYQLTREAVDMRDEIDGIFYFCDEMAVGGLKALREARLGIPKIGYDGWIAGEYIGLSTMEQPAEELGREGAKLLLDIMTGRKPNFPLTQREFKPVLRARNPLCR